MPSSRSRRARRLVQQIEATTLERHAAWSEGAQANRTETLTSDLDHLHDDKRLMRREIYREAPVLEGRPVFKGIPGGRP